MEDITEKRKAEEQLRQLAYFDSLTRLPNRKATEEHLIEALSHARKKKTLLSVFLIDIDHFKNINDTFGHPAGDQLLIEVTTVLKQRLRSNDFLGRIGGDEFMLIVNGFNDRQAIQSLASELCQALKQPLLIDKTLPVNAKVSIGISIFPEHGNDSMHLIRHADTALYQAKALGRNTYHIYTPALTLALEHRISMESRLESALEASALNVVYQPIVSVKYGTILGAEALLRWQDDVLGDIPPVEFIPLAEECGLIARIGRMVLEKACQAIALWVQAGLEVSFVTVNISAIQFSEFDLFDQIKIILDEVNLDPNKLTLEITEKALMQNKSYTKRTLLQLRQIGVNLAIDDFGTGYSSLAYLKYLAVNTLKIDKSFIDDIPGDFNDEQITKTIIAMAKSLNLKVVAEGIETSRQLDFLKRYDCDYFQGYYAFKAVSEHEFKRLLRQQEATAV